MTSSLAGTSHDTHDANPNPSVGKGELDLGPIVRPMAFS